jgi:hypothetical protein
MDDGFMWFMMGVMAVMLAAMFILVTIARDRVQVVGTLVTGQCQMIKNQRQMLVTLADMVRQSGMCGELMGAPFDILRLYKGPVESEGQVKIRAARLGYHPITCMDDRAGTIYILFQHQPHRDQVLPKIRS